MNTAVQLEQQLMSIHRKSYPAYKSLAGSWQFSGFILHIDHVQGDPFAAPSKVSVEVSQKTAAFPEELFDRRDKRIALQDHLTREFSRQVGEYMFQAKGSGKSGPHQHQPMRPGGAGADGPGDERKADTGAV